VNERFARETIDVFVSEPFDVAAELALCEWLDVGPTLKIPVVSKRQLLKISTRRTARRIFWISSIRKSWRKVLAMEPNDNWTCNGWGDHERGQLEVGASLNFLERLLWLQDADRLAARLERERPWITDDGVVHPVLREVD
jgi:hypothetical protein